jgi:hypothetical protein
MATLKRSKPAPARTTVRGVSAPSSLARFRPPAPRAAASPGVVAARIAGRVAADDVALEEERPTWCYLRVTEADARELLAGKVPEVVRAQARCAIDWEFDLAKSAARPVPPRIQNLLRKERERRLTR